MPLWTHVALVAVQLNSWFPLKDVQHLIPPRLHQYGVLFVNSSATYVGSVALTRPSKYAILACESNRMHFFLHDGLCIRRCIWDDDVMLDEKYDIASSVLVWLESGGKPCEFVVNDAEDSAMLSDLVRKAS